MERNIMAKILEDQEQREVLWQAEHWEEYTALREDACAASGWPWEGTGSRPLNQAYQAISHEAALDYDLVKQAMLQQLNITEETHHRWFLENQQPPGARLRVVAQQLVDLVALPWHPNGRADAGAHCH
ncbi:UNVERIFIED_CONTAM: hypothetical protein FKN15_029287 [Acipenser sinensis]